MLSLYFQRNALILFGLSLSSGIAFLLTLSSLSFWLAELNTNKSIIGLFILVSLPYSLKFLWSPLLEAFSLPFLTKYFGHKKSWALLSQILTILCIIGLGFSHPEKNLWLTAIWAFAVAFFAASLDIITDGLRLEILSDKLSGYGAAIETIGFRFGMLISGAGTLYLSTVYNWSIAYFITGCCCSIGLLSILFIKNKNFIISSQTVTWNNLYSSIKTSWLILLNKPYLVNLIFFIGCFRFCDAILNSMAAPFLWDLGFTKVECANISKCFGIIMMVLGGTTGGYIIHRFTIKKSIVLCIVLQTFACLMFAIQSIIGHHMPTLFLSMGTESFCSGLSATTFIASLASFCKVPYAMSHFTLLYSLGSLARVIISPISGTLAEMIGWTLLFFIASVICIPTTYFFLKIKPYFEQLSSQK